jgi:hypothetical protein
MTYCSRSRYTRRTDLQIRIGYLFIGPFYLKFKYQPDSNSLAILIRPQLPGRRFRDCTSLARIFPNAEFVLFFEDENFDAKPKK